MVGTQGIVPQTLAEPPPPHTSGDVQVPQANAPPHPLGTEPQFFPSAVQVVGAQPQTLSAPAPPQVAGALQLPQLNVPPQPSATVPQFFPNAAQVVGVQPQTLATPPPPQVRGEAQVPHDTDAPHPSGMLPQSRPCAAQVVGVHPQRLKIPPPAQVCGAVQLPQFSVPPHPSASGPQFLPRSAQVGAGRGVHAPTVPLTQEATAFTQAPDPQLSVKPAKSSSINPSQSSSLPLHCSGTGLTTPTHGPKAPSTHTWVPSLHSPNFDEPQLRVSLSRQVGGRPASDTPASSIVTLTQVLVLGRHLSPVGQSES